MRGDNGLFTLKGTEPRKLRSIMLTQFCWDKLQELGAKDGCSRSDLLERWAASGNISEMENQVAKLLSENQELITKLAVERKHADLAAHTLRIEKDSNSEQLKYTIRQLQEERDILKHQKIKTLEFELAKIRKERDELDAELNQLHSKNGDLNLELDLLREKSQQTAANQPSNPPSDHLREALAEIIAKTEQQLTGYTTKSFSRGLKDLKSLL